MLGRDVKGVEDFAVLAESSLREGCLAAVRWAEVMLLLVGDRYALRGIS